VRFRIDRTLREVRRYSREEHVALTSLIKQRCNLALDKQRHFKMARSIIERGKGATSTFALQSFRSMKIVRRSSPCGSLAMRRRCAGLPIWACRIGFTIDTGSLPKIRPISTWLRANGAGKTSTVCSVLAEADETTNIMTIEDPVEIRLPGNAWQVSVDERTGVTFPTAMRAFMRSDPDIIMCGEIRDAETAKEACAGGLAGRRVWATTHAPDAIRAVQRLLEFGVHRSTIAQSLKSVLAQRIVRRLCRIAKWRNPYRSDRTPI